MKFKIIFNNYKYEILNKLTLDIFQHHTVKNNKF